MYTGIETMEEMYDRLQDCGSGVKVKAVMSAITTIKKASGQLDSQNLAVALYHLAVALTGTEFGAFSALENAVAIGQVE